MKPNAGVLHLSLGIRQLLVAVMLIVGFVGLALILFQAQAENQRNLEALFQVRGTIGARFAQSYVNDVFAREQRVARAHLGGAAVSQNQFGDVLDSFGFNAGVLLDHRGRVLLVVPQRPSLLGHDITGQYLHLRTAVAGRRAVSRVVPSAARGSPLVAFALPYDALYGRRILSGGFDVSSSPLGEYLRNALPQSGTSAYIVDDAGIIVASNGRSSARVQSLRGVDGDLLAAIARGKQGPYMHAGIARYFVARAVLGTLWRVVITVPQNSLYSPVSGATRWIPWALYFAFVLGALYALWLLFTLTHSRAEQTRLYAELDRVARLDSLTAAYNRRQLDEDLSRELTASLRYGRSAAFILLDLDHFKQANDRYGHQAGDRILQETASFLQGAVRETDRVYRYGGEEFAIIAPDTEQQGVRQLGERLRAGIEGCRHPSGKPMTASIGIALIPEHAKTSAAVIAAADRALYQAKASGRNSAVIYTGHEAGMQATVAPAPYSNE